MVQWKVQSMSHIDADISRSINCIYNNVYGKIFSVMLIKQCQTWYCKRVKWSQVKFSQALWHWVNFKQSTGNKNRTMKLSWDKFVAV